MCKPLCYLIICTIICRHGLELQQYASAQHGCTCLCLVTVTQGLCTPEGTRCELPTRLAEPFLSATYMLPASTYFVQRIGHECRDACAYFFSGYRLQWTCFGSLGSCACALHCTACTFTTTGVAAAASGCLSTASGPSMVLVSKPLLGPVYQQLAWPNMVAAAYYAASGWRLWEYCGLLARDMLL